MQAAIAGELRRLREERGGRALSVLDVGCWDGATTARYRDILGGSARGVEIFRAQAERARSAGIDVASVDLEVGTLPWSDSSVDVIVANQVFEHLKNVWLPMSEIARVLAPGGVLIFSVPNLASLHNRVMLALGLQPSSIRTFGPHVRGYTYRQARAFVEHGGFLRIRRAVGVGFYPFPARAAMPLARLWVGASHTPVIVAERVAREGTSPPWSAMQGDVDVGAQTFYAARELPDHR